MEKEDFGILQGEEKMDREMILGGVYCNEKLRIS